MRISKEDDFNMTKPKSKTEKKFTLTSPEVLEDCIAYFDFLPFFNNEVLGWSIEEKTPASFWFTDAPGPWEWKGPIAREGNYLYGKFFKKRAGWVSRKVFGKFSQIRRTLPASKNPRTALREAWLLDYIREVGSIITPDLKEPWAAEFGTLSGLETALANLQMRTDIVIVDFEYRHDRFGNPYGWGLARYMTPESFIGEDFLAEENLDTEATLEELVSNLAKKLPKATPEILKRLIAGK